MLVHCRVTPSMKLKIVSTHLYSWVERGTVRVKCLAQEHNTMSLGRGGGGRREGRSNPDHCTVYLKALTMRLLHLLNKVQYIVNSIFSFLGLFWLIQCIPYINTCKYNFPGILPTADEETNTLGGFVASVIFLAKVLVVSKRLFLNSFMNSSFHLFKIQTIKQD